MADVDWKELLERINVMSRSCRKDPCGAYPQMDYETVKAMKTNYRDAERSKASEQSIAQAAMGLANRLHSMSKRANWGKAITRRLLTWWAADARPCTGGEIGYWPTFAERLHGL